MIDPGQNPQHANEETYCPSCGVPESAGLGQHGADCTVVYPSATASDDTTRVVPLDWTDEPVADVITKTAEFVGTVPGARTFTFGYDAADRELEDGEEPDPGEAIRWWVKATVRRRFRRGAKPVEQSWIRYGVTDPAGTTPDAHDTHAAAIIAASIALLEAMGADRLLLDALTNPNRQD